VNSQYSQIVGQNAREHSRCTRVPAARKSDPTDATHYTKNPLLGKSQLVGL